MKRSSNIKRKREHQYQIAGTLLVVASLGFAGAYLQQRNETRKEEAIISAQEEEKQETKSTSSVVKPKTDTNEIVQPAPVMETPVQQAPTEEATQETAAPQQHFDGTLTWPLEGEILIHYSMDHTVYYATLQQYKYSPAVVIKGNVNDKVISAAAGKVTSIVNDPQTGCTVTVDIGDGYEAVYGQLKEVPLATGQQVNAGEVVGYISEPTKYYSIEGCNLYFQLLKDKEPANPMEFFAE